MRGRLLNRLPLLVEAALAMLVIEAVLRLRGIISCQYLVTCLSHLWVYAPSHNPRRMARALQAVATVTRRLPGRHQCLSEALTARVLLGRRGFAVTVHLGVMLPSASARVHALPEPPSALEAHAWVEYQGRVLTGGPIGDFSRLPSLPAPGTPRGERPGPR